MEPFVVVVTRKTQEEHSDLEQRTLRTVVVVSVSGNKEQTDFQHAASKMGSVTEDNSVIEKRKKGTD